MNAGQQAAVDMVDFILSDLIKLAQDMAKARPSSGFSAEQQALISATLLAFADRMDVRRNGFRLFAAAEFHEGAQK